MDFCERDDEKWIKGMSMHDVKKRNFDYDFTLRSA